MFIPEVKWGKTNDRDECRKIARTLAVELANTFGGEVDKLTNIVYEIIDTAFMVNKTYEDLVSYCDGDTASSLLFATQSYIIVMGKICGSDIPIDAMAHLANAVLQSMSFWNIIGTVKELAAKVFAHADMKRSRKHGND